MVAGLVGAVAAAVPGLIDFFSIRDPRAGKICLIHLAVNAGLVVLYAVNAWIRTLVAPDSVLPILLSAVGVAGLAVTGWLGGELVYVHKVGGWLRERFPRQGAAVSARHDGTRVAIPKVATRSLSPAALTRQRPARERTRSGALPGAGPPWRPRPCIGSRVLNTAHANMRILRAMM